MLIHKIGVLNLRVLCGVKSIFINKLANSQTWSAFCESVLFVCFWLFCLHWSYVCALYQVLTWALLLSNVRIPRCRIWIYINRVVLDMCNGVLMHQMQNVHCKRIKRELLPFWCIYSFGWICNHDLYILTSNFRCLWWRCLCRTSALEFMQNTQSAISSYLAQREKESLFGTIPCMVNLCGAALAFISMRIFRAIAPQSIFIHFFHLSRFSLSPFHDYVTNQNK